MTDHIHSLTIALSKDVSRDDIGNLKTALMQLKGVIAVEEHVADSVSWMAEKRAKVDLENKLFEAFEDQ